LLNDKSAIIDWIRNTSANKILITGHANADPDAVASALSLKELIERIRNIIVDITFPEGVSELSSHILKMLNMNNIIINIEPDHDYYILVDTSSPEQLGELGDKILKSKKPIIIIDHHRMLPITNKIVATYIDENSPSSAELVYNLFKDCSITPSVKTAQLLLTAILHETRRFMYAQQSTFKTIVELIQYGADYNLAQEMIKLTVDYSERVARLKAASRIRAYAINENIIIITWVGAFEASVAKSLIDMGADVVFVLNTDDDKVSRISARSKASINLDLSEIMSKIAKKFNGIGGGHKNAAGAHLNGSNDLVVKEILSEIELKMGKLRRII
jgi:nanoRNase/pAp phosphatase (c-di-AMP/oligoRNAs hydrolase)